jgi:hypothetical protein
MIANQYVCEVQLKRDDIPSMAHPNSTIYNLSAKGVEQLDYFATKHYQVTHDFLVNLRRMLDRLLDTTPSAPVRRIRKSGKPK